MPQFNFNEEQLVALVNAIFAGAAKLPPTTEEAPLVVHFTELTQKVEDPFSKHCGSCHRLLTQKQGGLGKGDIGPNLSGLFTEHYPLNFGQGERWTEDNLRNWLKNPRKYRDVTPMPPQILSPDEFNQLISILMDKVVVREVDEGGGSAVP
jgi:cytochrome c2